MEPTLTEVLTALGYTHSGSTTAYGARDICLDGKLVVVATASEAWEWLRATNQWNGEAYGPRPVSL